MTVNLGNELAKVFFTETPPGQFAALHSKSFLKGPYLCEDFT